MDYRLVDMSAPTLLVRPSAEADLPHITRIYAQAVQHGTGTFELDVPGLAARPVGAASSTGNGSPCL